MQLQALEATERLAETHISTLLATGDTVYKRKKARAFGFVDQQSLEARRRLCEDEVRLNRRLAPDVYLGTEEVIGPDGEVCDHVVTMRRLPADRSLAARLAVGDDVTGCVRAVARVMADFHAAAERGPDIDAAATPEAVASLWSDSLDDLERLLGGHDARPHRLRVAAREFLSGRQPLLRHRIARRLVVDGHGDLLTPDIYCLDDGPRILDCLEFDPRFRHGDVLLDLAFLAMDLRWRGRADLAELLMANYQEFAAEQHPASLFAHYQAYRALVRAKVACYRAAEGLPAYVAQVDSLLALAETMSERATVQLVILGGLPGTGKTTVAETFAATRGWTILNTDAVRREVTEGPAGDAWQEGAYAPALTQQVYATVFGRAATALGLGESVVVDASFHDPAQRATARELARRAHARLVEVACQVDRATADARLRQRDRSNPSDATPAIAAAMAYHWEPWPEAIVVDTGRTVEDAVAEVAAVAGGPG